MNAWLAAPDINAYVGGFLWVLTRISATLLIMPALSHSSAPIPIKIALALALTLAVYPHIHPLPAVDPLSPDVILIVFYQLLIGFSLGFIFRVIFQTFLLGANIIAMQMGLGFATMIDPSSGASVPLLSQYYSFLVTLIFLLFNGHLVVLELLIKSFKAIPVAPGGLSSEQIWAIIAWSRHLFVEGVLLSLPAVTSLLIVNFAFGVMSKAAPSLNIFSIGFPITLWLGQIIVYLTIAPLVPQLDHAFEAGVQASHVLLGIGGEADG